VSLPGHYSIPAAGFLLALEFCDGCSMHRSEVTRASSALWVFVLQDTDDVDFLLTMSMTEFFNCIFQLVATLIFIAGEPRQPRGQQGAGGRGQGSLCQAAGLYCHTLSSPALPLARHVVHLCSLSHEAALKQPASAVMRIRYRQQPNPGLNPLPRPRPTSLALPAWLQ
jgi:hypothetical protein